MQPYPPPPPPPPPGAYYPPPPPGYYPPPPPPPLGPEPGRGYALVALAIATATSAALLIIALQVKGVVNEGDREVRLANKIVWLLVLCGAVGIVESIRAIYGRWQAALSVGLTHLIMGAGVLFIGMILQDLGGRNLELSTTLGTLLGLGGALLVSGTMALIAIPQVKAYGRWKEARAHAQAMYPPPPPPPGYYPPPPPPQY